MRGRVPATAGRPFAPSPRGVRVRVLSGEPLPPELEPRRGALLAGRSDSPPAAAAAAAGADACSGAAAVAGAGAEEAPLPESLPDPEPRFTAVRLWETADQGAATKAVRTRASASVRVIGTTPNLALATWLPTDARQFAPVSLRLNSRANAFVLGRVQTSGFLDTPIMGPIQSETRCFSSTTLLADGSASAIATTGANWSPWAPPSRPRTSSVRGRTSRR